MENIRSFFDKVDDFFSIKTERIDELYKNSIGYPSLGNMDYFEIKKYIHNIANKLFLMNKEDRPIYAKLVIDDIEENYSSGLIFDYAESYECYYKDNEDGTCSISREPEPGYKRAEDMIDYIKETGTDKIKCDVSCLVSDVDSFVRDVFMLFIDFGIDIAKIVESVSRDQDLKELANEAANLSLVYNREDFSYKANRRECSATANQKYDTINALLKAAGWKGSDNTKTAEFIAWLVNGSKSYVRQYILSGERRDRNRISADAKLVEEKFNLIGINYNNGKIKIE